MIRQVVADSSIRASMFGGSFPRFAVYFHLAAHQRKGGVRFVFPSVATIMEYTGLTRSPVYDALGWLAKNGWITPQEQKTKVGHRKGWLIAEIDSETGLPVPESESGEPPAQTHTPTPEPEPAEEFNSQLGEEFLNANLGETAYLDDPEPQEVAPKPKPKPKTKTKTTTEIPAELLAVSGFAEAWADWVAYRQQAELRPMTAIGTTRQFSAMIMAVGGGVDVVACIDKAITSNWQGVHLDAVNNQPQSQAITKAAPNTEYQAMILEHLDAQGALSDDGELLPPWETNVKAKRVTVQYKPKALLASNDDMPF